MTTLYIILLLTLINQPAAEFEKPQPIIIENCNNDIKQDTLIKLNNQACLCFNKFSKDTKLWYNPFIIINNNKLKIIEYNYENGSLPSIKISPNDYYMLMDEIIRGYVYKSETDSILYENYFCNIIDINNTLIIKRMQSNCDAEWNKNNELISETRVIFSPFETNSNNDQTENTKQINQNNQSSDNRFFYSLTNKEDIILNIRNNKDVKIWRNGIEIKGIVNNNGNDYWSLSDTQGGLYTFKYNGENVTFNSDENLIINLVEINNNKNRELIYKTWLHSDNINKETLSLKDLELLNNKAFFCGNKDVIVKP